MIRRIIFFVTCVLVINIYAQSQINNELDHRQINKKIARQARQEAIQLKKQGYLAVSDKNSIKRQLQKSLSMQSELINNNPKYMIVFASYIAANPTAAKLHSMYCARLELVEQIERQLTQRIEMKVANEEINPADAETITSIISNCKTIISIKLGNIIPTVDLYRQLPAGTISPSFKFATSPVDLYRQLPAGTIESRIILGYEANEAIKVALSVIQSDLNKRGNEVAEKLNTINF
ncbi:MAG: hypothetical protein LUE98_12865 [Tannerellaceae bacterium]|nr:hypothetical protein [Tannerellaceae bacterium]